MVKDPVIGHPQFLRNHSGEKELIPSVCEAQKWPHDSTNTPVDMKF